MNSRGLDELESAQREVARALRKLASGLETPATFPGAGSPLVESQPTEGPSGSALDSRLAETVLDGLRQASEPLARGGATQLRIEELSAERVARGEASRILPTAGADAAGSGATSAPRPLDPTAGGPTSGGANTLVVGDATAVANSFGGAFEPVTRAVRELTTAVGSNTGAVSSNTSELSNGLRSVLGGFLQPDKGGGGLFSVLKSGFGLAPLALGITGLFGKKDQEPEPPRLFDAPASIAIEAASSEGIPSRLSGTDRDQFGRIRADEDGQRRAPTPAQQPQVIVNVSAMDSQSFMDRSADIARALREAMLHMHPVNDVIGEI